MSLNLEGLFLGVGLRDLCLFEGVGLGKDPFGLLLGSLLSLGLVGFGLNRLDALFLLGLNDGDLHFGLGCDLDLLQIDFLEHQGVGEVVHLFLILLLKGKHRLVVLIKHANNHILYKIKWILGLNLMEDLLRNIFLDGSP